MESRIDFELLFLRGYKIECMANMLTQQLGIYMEKQKILQELEKFDFNPTHDFFETYSIKITHYLWSVVVIKG